MAMVKLVGKAEHRGRTVKMVQSHNENIVLEIRCRFQFPSQSFFGKVSHCKVRTAVNVGLKFPFSLYFGNKHLPSDLLYPPTLMVVM